MAGIRGTGSAAGQAGCGPGLVSWEHSEPWTQGWARGEGAATRDLWSLTREGVCLLLRGPWGATGESWSEQGPEPSYTVRDRLWRNKPGLEKALWSRDPGKGIGVLMEEVGVRAASRVDRQFCRGRVNSETDPVAAPLPTSTQAGLGASPRPPRPCCGISAQRGQMSVPVHQARPSPWWIPRVWHAEGRQNAPADVHVD